MTTTRCANCGCGLDAGAVECRACGQLVVGGTSAGPMGHGDFKMKPMPAARYDVELGAVESVSWSFKLWSENLGKLFVLGIIPYLFMIPAMIIGVVVALGTSGDGPFDIERWIESPGNLVLAIGGGGVLFIFFTFVWLCCFGGIFHLLNEKTQGVDVGIGTALASAVKHTGWLFLGYLGYTAIATLAMTVFFAPIGVAIAADEPLIGIGAIPGLALAFGLFVVAARLIPAWPAVVVEDIDIATAFGRSWELTRGHTWTVVGGALLFFAVYFGISMVTGLIGIIPIIGAIVQLVINAMLLPLGAAFPFALYAGAVRAAGHSSATRG